MRRSGRQCTFVALSDLDAWIEADLVTALWIMAAVLFIAGIVTLLDGAVALGIVLMAIGLLVGPGGVNVLT